MVDIPVVLLEDDLAPPVYARAGDAGADLVARTGAMVAAGGGRALVPTGVRVAIPEGYAGFVQPRSGLAWRHGITVLNSPGLIDAGYRDEIAVIVINTDPVDDFEIRRGDRIAQLVVQRVEHACFVPVAELGHRSEVLAASATRGVSRVPELPEVEALARFLTEKSAGQVIERAEVAALSALKTYNPPIDALRGRTLGTTIRRGKFLGLQADDLWLVVHLARGGWVQWRDTMPPARARPGKGPLALRVGLESGGGFDVTEQGTEKRLALWVVPELADVEPIARLGPDPLDPGFGVQELATLLDGRAGNIKTVLTDQSVIAGVGNAYSDEALHAAKLSPYRSAAKLDAGEVAALHAALTGVLGDAVQRSLGLPAKGLKAEKRSGLSVHGRTGEPCPVCGDSIREVSFATKSLQYCPTCQTGGRPLADRRLSRLLK